MVASHRGRDYAALDGSSPSDGGTVGCQQGFRPLPSGWRIARGGDDSAAVAAAFPWGAAFVVVADGSRCRTATGGSGSESTGDRVGHGTTPTGGSGEPASLVSLQSAGGDVFAVRGCTGRILITRTLPGDDPPPSAGNAGRVPLTAEQISLVLNLSLWVAPIAIVFAGGLLIFVVACCIDLSKAAADKAADLARRCRLRLRGLFGREADPAAHPTGDAEAANVPVKRGPRTAPGERWTCAICSDGGGGAGGSRCEGGGGVAHSVCDGCLRAHVRVHCEGVGAAAGHGAPRRAGSVPCPLARGAGGCGNGAFSAAAVVPAVRGDAGLLDRLWAAAGRAAVERHRLAAAAESRRAAAASEQRRTVEDVCRAAALAVPPVDGTYIA
jgi:hypothetical protein